MSHCTPTARRAQHASIALLSCRMLCYQIAVTRLLSVVFWYVHWAAERGGAPWC